ncbi:MAG TPA: hypothetical protein PKE38_07770 [Ignavibacteriaceae bacterium]|nr:hypothetical protein [Ignavibacteriaceae bacterium]
MDILEQFYNEITQTVISLQKFGETSFELNRASYQGYVGITTQDTLTLLVGMQNILSNHLGKPYLKLAIGRPEKIDSSNNFFSAMKGIHRYFFISILSSIDAASEQICKDYLNINPKGERAYHKVLSKLKSPQQLKWKLFYESLKIIRNECAHPSKSKLHIKEIEKLTNAGLDFLIFEGKIGINCPKYQPVAEKALECISVLKSIKRQQNNLKN